MLRSTAIISDGQGTTRLEEILIRDPRENEVLVEVKSAGICQTDTNKINGLRESFIPGHEGAGVVVGTGQKVQNLEVGDRVLLNWAMPCNDCFQCDRGNKNLCETNSPIVGGKKYFDSELDTASFNGKSIPRLFNLGTFSRHTLIPETAATKFDAKLSFSSAGIVSCSVLTGYGSVMHTAKVSKGSIVAVIGCGGVGLNVIQTARLCGAKTIIAIDRDNERLKTSQAYGSTNLIQVVSTDLVPVIEQVLGLSNGRGVDYSFECTGIPQLAFAPLAMIRHGGTAVQISGVEQELSVDMNLFEFDKKYINPLYGNCDPERDIPEIVSLYTKEKFILDEQITHTFKLEDHAEVFKKFERKEIGKGVFITN